MGKPLAENTGKLLVGIVICDDAEAVGGCEGCWKYFETRFQSFADKIKLVPIYIITDAVLSEDEITKYTGFIITGSPHSVNDDQLEWNAKLTTFLKLLINMKEAPKVFGICFGHQAIAKAFGCTITNNPSKIGNVVNTEKLNIKPGLKKSKLFQECFGSRDYFYIMQAHGECIKEVPSKHKVLAKSNSCEHEIVLWTDRIISTQGHPEFITSFMRNVIIPDMYVMGYFKSEDDMNKSIKSLKDDDITKTVKFVGNFLLNDNLF